MSKSIANVARRRAALDANDIRVQNMRIRERNVFLAKKKDWNDSGNHIVQALFKDVRKRMVKNKTNPNPKKPK